MFVPNRCVVAPRGLWHCTPVLRADEKDVAYAKQIRPILQKDCLECHAGKKPKGGLDLDRLSPDSIWPRKDTE
jgi:hypothetical protein